jgi:hypothetical protein
MQTNFRQGEHHEGVMQTNFRQGEHHYLYGLIALPIILNWLNVNDL